MEPVLIVDDEPGALDAIMYALDWEHYGFTIKGVASNGRQALELLKKNQYSLMITDIRMPGISGLELLQEIRKFTNIPVIIMSGYQEMDYLKTCLKYSVKDYLLKPVEEEDLAKLLVDIKNEITHEHMLNRQLHFGIPAIKDQLLKKWTQGLLREEEVRDQFGMLGIEIKDSQRICCLIVEFDFMEATTFNQTNFEIQMKRYAARNVIEELILNQGYVYEVSEERFGVVLFHAMEAENGINIQKKAEEIMLFIEKCVKIPITIGIGTKGNTLDNAFQSYSAAEKMLDRRFFLGGQTILSADQLPDDHEKLKPFETQGVISIIHAVKEQNAAALQSCIQKQKKQFVDAETPKPLVQSTVVEILVQLLRVVQEVGGHYDNLFELDLGDYKSFMQYKELDLLFKYVEEKCMVVLEFLAQQKPSQPAKMVHSVKKVVELQFSSNLSLKAIAEQIHLHPVYLGKLFKAEEGLSFNDYLLKVRMEKAKELLLYSDKKVYEIALEVGYQELDWFYKKFKEYTGVSTSEYRNKAKVSS
ncbi:response regulator [Paenibacillus sp. FJAT-27812]|uniref:response regulator n=1 Tax=Paenibacillus sp. FJAT-27812 TaxID=1684143 RepID=UPI0006A76033|nr:response regulator [Paenibacillus sp. FJAT-27812]